MSYEESLAQRIRVQLAGQPDVTEKKMFSGLAFLIGGHMAIAASGQGGILVRIDPALSEQLAEQPEVEVAVMKGRQMRGWLRVESDSLRSKKQLKRWVDLGVSHASSLPAKTKGIAKR